MKLAKMAALGRLSMFDVTFFFELRVTGTTCLFDDGCSISIFAFAGNQVWGVFSLGANKDPSKCP